MVGDILQGMMKLNENFCVLIYHMKTFLELASYDSKVIEFVQELVRAG